MYIVKAEANQVEKIVDMSVRAFETDVYVSRIFIDSVYHRKGYGIRLMDCIEENFPYAAEFNLDTPCWNERTNAFYKRLGYRTIKVEDGFVFYQKSKSETTEEDIGHE